MSKIQYISELVMRNKGRMIMNRAVEERIPLPLLIILTRGDQRLKMDGEELLIVRSMSKMKVISDADVVVCLFKEQQNQDRIFVKQEEKEYGLVVKE